MSQLPAVADVLDETAALNGLAPRNNGFQLEPRCRVCRNDTLRIKVNNLLASGASYAMILRALRDDNAKLDKADRVTIDSIRNHTNRHFPVQNVAKATYRRILERRAQENGVDFVKGVATAITPMAFYETVMVKGFETLVDSGTTVDVNTGMIAAGRLQALIDLGPAVPELPTTWCRWIASSTRSIPRCRRWCGRRSCARSMDPSRLIHRRMSSKTVTTWRTSTRPRNPRSQTRTAGLRVHRWTASSRRPAPRSRRRRCILRKLNGADETSRAAGGRGRRRLRARR